MIIVENKKITEVQITSKGIIYPRFQKKYRYDESTGKLVDSGVVDMQAMIDSSKDCALSEILNKFSNEELNQYMSSRAALFEDSDIVDSGDMIDALDELNEVSNHLYDIKDKYGLPGDDLKDIIKAINSRKEELANKIKQFSKGVEENESKEIKQESESKEFSSGSKGSQEESK